MTSPQCFRPSSGSKRGSLELAQSPQGTGRVQLLLHELSPLDNYLKTHL